MTSTMLSECRSAFENYGYRLIDGVPSQSHNVLWYRNERSTSEACHIAILQYKPTWDAYGIGLGVSSSPARLLLNKAIPVIRAYSYPGILTGPWDASHRPCWVSFDPGRLLWKSLAIPDASNRAGWPHQLQELRTKFLEPIFWPIQGAQAIQELLFRDEKPFEWAASNMVLRTAEIVALSRVSKSDPEIIKKKILTFRSKIVRDMYGSTEPEKMVDDFFSAVWH